MISSKLVRVLAALALTASAGNAGANVIFVESQTQQVAPGQLVSLEIHMDFLQATVGGSFDLFYDSNFLQFVAFQFDNDFLTNVADPDFAVMPDNCLLDGAAITGCMLGDAELNSIGFGTFESIIGEHLVASVVFEALAPGISAITMADSDGAFGPFVSAVNAETLHVLYNGAKVLVTPLPASAWLLMSALGIALGLRRSR